MRVRKGASDAASNVYYMMRETRGAWPSRRREAESDMEKRSGIRLSTMEIILLTTLLGSLALGIVQAWQRERLQRQLDRTPDRAFDAEAEQ